MLPLTLSRRAACAAVALALAGAGAQAGEPRALPPWRGFVFDQKFTGSEGLRFEMDRPVATVDPSGGRRIANEARFAPPTAIAGAPRFEHVRVTEAPMSMLASGLDHDGVTPLLVTYEARGITSYLDVFTVGGSALLAAEQTGVGRNRTVLDATGDLMMGSMPGKRYRVTAGVVCHGLIVIFSTISAVDSKTQGWVDSANAFIVSQDQGRTWSLAYESAPFSPGASRGAPWAMQNWWPLKRSVHPQDAFFAATDYCANPGSPGGNFFLMRATRPSPAHLWTVHEGTVALQVSGRDNEHMHVGGVVRHGDHGIRAFLALGDNRRNNRIVSLINRDGDYLSGKWEKLSEYHGAAGAVGIEGNQFVGCAPGPFENSALVGADLSIEQIMLLTMDPEAAHPVTDRLFGLPTANHVGSNAFIIRTPTPERGGPYCANTEPFSFITIPFTRRALYSPDGLHWAQAAAPESGYPIVHAGHLYFDGNPGQGIIRTPVPSFYTANPLLVGPGGLQQTKASPVVDAGLPPRMVPLARDGQGRWIDAGSVLDLQPPAHGPVYRVDTHENDPSPWIARVYPGGLGNRFTRVLGDHVQVRLWVRHVDSSRSATLTIGLGDSATAPQFYRNVIIPSTDSWVPIVATAPVTIAPNATLQLYVRCSGDICNDQSIYLALDATQEGLGFPGYPMPPETAPNTTGTPYPDEQGRVTGFACEKSWTVTLALQIPEDGFDFLAELLGRWPLATIWGDDRNYVELFANTDRSLIEARFTSNGRVVHSLTCPTATLVRGSPILVSVAQPLGFSGPELTASAGGMNTSTAARGFVAAPGINVPPREIRFWSQTAPASSTGRTVRTSPLLVFGGRVDERRALSRTERENLLRSLSFLAGPPP